MWLLFALVVAASDTGRRIDLDWGFIEYGKNEVSIISTVGGEGDPPKLRMGSVAGVGYGAHSWNRVINGVQREGVLFQGKQDERFRADPTNPAAEFTLHLNNGGGFEDRNMVRVLEIRSDTIELLGVKFTREELARLKAHAAIDASDLAVLH